MASKETPTIIKKLVKGCHDSRTAYVGPNIIGKSQLELVEQSSTGQTGAFKTTAYPEFIRNVSYGSGGSMGWGHVELEASKSNSAYSGSKLQPSALQLLACIRC